MFILCALNSGFHKTTRVRSGNSEQKSAILVLSAFFFNQLQIYCFHLCISIMNCSMFILCALSSGFHKTTRVRSGNSGQKSAILVLSALFFNQLQIYCFHLCISIMNCSGIFTLLQKNTLGMHEKISWNRHVRNYWYP